MAEIKMLEIVFTQQGERQAIYPVVIHSGAEAILVDCGYPGQLLQIEAALAAQGIAAASLTKVVITHHDYDHMGALAELKAKYPAVQVVSSAEQQPYIGGLLPSLRLQQAEALLPTLPPAEQEWGRRFCEQLRAVPAVPVDALVAAGDSLSEAGDCVVIDTPGHMPGHISLYLPGCKAVVTGDAAVRQQENLSMANPHFTLDIAKAEASLQALLALPAIEYYCYHGGLWRRPALR